MTKKTVKPATKELTDAELEKVSGGWSWGASQGVTDSKLLGDDIGVPIKKGGDLKDGLSTDTKIRK